MRTPGYRQLGRVIEERGLGMWALLLTHCGFVPGNWTLSRASAFERRNDVLTLQGCCESVNEGVCSQHGTVLATEWLFINGSSVPFLSAREEDRH